MTSSSGRGTESRSIASMINTPYLGLRLLPMRGLLLVGAESAQLALCLEQLLHRRRAECARELVLQVGLTGVEAEDFEVGAAAGRGEAGIGERTPEVRLLRGVVEAG